MKIIRVDYVYTVPFKAMFMSTVHGYLKKKKKC